MGRFVAAGLVLVTHSTLYYGKYVDDSVRVWHFGEIGVPIFFVISGIVMVMSSTRLTRDAAGSREFAIRRLIRIVPLYWLATAVATTIFYGLPWVVERVRSGITLPWVSEGASLDVVYTVKSFLFVPALNPEGATDPGLPYAPIHGVGWTLLHEMFFYALFALVMLARGRPARWASAVIVGLYVLGRVVEPTDPILDMMTRAYNLYFVVGMVIGTVVVWGDRHRRLTQALTWGLTVVALAKWLLPGLTGWFPLDPLPLALGAAMLAFTALPMPGPARVGVQLGNSSYSLYLFHPIVAPAVILVLDKALSLGAPVTITVTWFVTVAVGHGIYLWVENPLTRWTKRTFRRSRPKAPPPVPRPETTS